MSEESQRPEIDEEKLVHIMLTSDTSKKMPEYKDCILCTQNNYIVNCHICHLPSCHICHINKA